MSIVPSETTAGAFGEQRKLNQLDPGPPRRRKTKLGCKCALYAVLLLLSLGFGWIAYRALDDRFKSYRDPYSFLYQDLKEAYRPQDVVRPLVDSNQTFDVIATVWLRSPKKDVPNNEYGVDWYRNDLHWMKSRRDLKLEETAIFSDTVFKRLRLQDKSKKTSVDFQVPTQIFKLRDLNNYDLRASFVLIPSAPSPLDHASSFSTWIPLNAEYPPMRSWTDDKTRPLLADNIVDSYGVFAPLLSFHDIQSKCPDSSTNTDDVDEEETDAHEDAHEDDVVLPWGVAENRKKWISTKGKPVLSSHPYIITRSFLRVVDMTKIFNKQAFDAEHSKLKLYSCGRLGTVNGYRAEASWKDCLRSYQIIGNHAVKIRLTRTSAKTGKELTEWVYAPHLSLAESAWGSQDLVPIPVNRETCSRGDFDTPEDNGFVNITWNIAFSGTSQFGLSFGDAASQVTPPHNTTEAEHVQLSQHMTIEYSQGLAGHHFRDNFHPRREIGLIVIEIICFLIAGSFDILYWYTRSSTAGISVTGISMLAGSYILGSLVKIAHMQLQSGAFSFSVLDLIIMLYSFVLASLMLKAVTRAEIHWWKRLLPIVVLAPATHSERASQRVDSRTPLRFIMTAYLVLSSFLYLVNRQDYYVIGRQYTIGEPFKSSASRFFYNLPLYSLHSATILGWILQLTLNHRMKTFAGMYKMTACIKLAALLSTLAARSPWIVGESTMSVGWTYYDLFTLLCYLGFAFQAFSYSSVASLDEEEDTK